jgi:hypothetical protein
LLLEHVTGKGSHEILYCGRTDDGLGAHAARSQEAQQVLDVVFFAPSGLSSNRPATPPASARELLDMGFAEIGRVNIMLCKPTVERCGVQCLDAHHGGDELLPYQQLDKGSEVPRDRTGGAGRNRSGVIK